MSSRPHDSLVRDTFEHPEHARGELQHLLPPALSARLDWSTLEPVPGTFVDPALQDSYSDLLFRIKLGERVAYLYLLFEHQSKPHPLLVFRQLQYSVSFLTTWIEDHPRATRLPVVIPILLYHGPPAWPYATRFEDLLDVDADTRALVLGHVPRFRILVDDLTAQTDEQLRSRAMTELGRIVLWCLKTARSTDDLVAGIAGWAALFRKVREAPNGLAAIARIWEYLMAVHEAPHERVLPALAAALEDEAQRQDMASIAEQLIEKGEKKGIEKGQREMLLRQLEQRFGPLPAELAERVKRAPRADLERWAGRVLTAASLDDAVDSSP